MNDLKLDDLPKINFDVNLPENLLRDWFAGMAMEGELPFDNGEEPWESKEALASWSYEIADAMMKARDK